MGRDKYTLETSTVDRTGTGNTPVRPMLTVRYTGSSADLEVRFRNPDDRTLDATEIDLTFRLQTPLGDDATGVVAVSDNVTGDYVLELDTEVGPIDDFVQAARRYADETGHDTAYTVRFCTAEGVVVAYGKQVFLVYGRDGTLLRHHSLIPNDVEI